MAKLIIIRGNSGSGKTVLAKKLQENYGTEQCLLLHQDVLRREILHASDKAGTPAVPMIKTLIDFGREHYPITIIEGILRRDVYGPMLEDECKNFGDQAYVYYLDIPFSKTVQHNNMKDNSFSEDLLKKWWLDHDVLTDHDIVFKQGNVEDFYHKIIDQIK